MTDEFLHIAVGVLTDSSGRVLIAQRGNDVHQGGLWEFPGGKLEANEGVWDALRRELHEELAIEVSAARPFLRISHSYPDQRVLLDVWRVDSWLGHAFGREGQPLAWVHPDRLNDYVFPAADRPIISALQLPSVYLITPETTGDRAFLERLDACLQGGIRLVQLRSKQLSQGAFQHLTENVLRLCERHAARLILNTTPMTALRLGAHGVHLTSARLLQLQERPLPGGFLVAASCHNAMEIDQAVAIGADFVLLSPVFPTTSHPDAHPLGWQEFQNLSSRANRPVLALGGLHPLDLPAAWSHGAHGIALISGLWDATDPRAAAEACTALSAANHRGPHPAPTRRH